MRVKMANEVTILKDHDFTVTEMQKIQQYKEQGLPGIGDVTGHQMAQMIDLYLNGSTYSQISMTVGVKKIIVMYLSEANGWYNTKREYLNEIEEKIKSRVIDTKLRNQEFMLLLIQAWQKKISNKVVKYLATENEEHMDAIDLKEVAQLMKAIEMIGELDNSGKDSKGKTPAVGLNVGNGVTIEKTGENSMTITPKDASISDMLKQLADSRRQEEKAKLIEAAGPPIDKKD